LNVEADQLSSLGRHHRDDPMKPGVSCLKSIRDSSLLASAGWNGVFHLWDVRAGSAAAAEASIQLPGKAFSMDASDQQLAVVATAHRRNVFIDLRNCSHATTTNNDSTNTNILLDRGSSLKYQTKCIQFFPNCQGIAVGSIEGRVAIEYLDDIPIDLPPTNKKKYAFKCHRISDVIYPVNAIAFHPQHDTFATGGADGTVITWDGNSIKKIATVAKLPTSVACVAFHPEGKQMAMASSYTFEEGEREIIPEKILMLGMCRRVRSGRRLSRSSVCCGVKRQSKFYYNTHFT
jgi:cell cycle arrest protein BUB3